MQAIEVDSNINNIVRITEFIDSLLEGSDCPMRTQMQIDIIIDEIVSNIVYYAYQNSTGIIRVEYENVTGEKPGALIRFIDQGVHYNPLEHEDPDITLSIEERDIGGLGIFMVKKIMDEIMYDYENEKNILTVIKYFG